MMIYNVNRTKARRRVEAETALIQFFEAQGHDGEHWARLFIDWFVDNPAFRAVLADWAAGACPAHRRDPSWKCPDCKVLSNA